MLEDMKYVNSSSSRGLPAGEKSAGGKSADVETGPPSMAVSIAGISRACSKDALASSAKAAREALSTE
jgi:hypothetical protein